LSGDITLNSFELTTALGGGVCVCVCVCLGDIIHDSCGNIWIVHMVARQHFRGIDWPEFKQLFVVQVGEVDGRPAVADRCPTHLFIILIAVFILLFIILLLVRAWKQSREMERTS